MGEIIVRGDRLVLGDQELVVGSVAWLEWLQQAEHFRYEGQAGHFGARRERFQRGGWYWKAYRRVDGRLRRSYLGRAEDLSVVRFERAAALLNADHSAPEPAPEPAGLLWTKLAPPALRDGIIGRTTVLARLEQALSHPVCVVTAPAGWGKTTLLAHWAEQSRQQNRPVAWLALDPEDDDPVRLWSYVCAALARYEPAILVAEATIRAPRNLSPVQLMTGLINALAQRHGPAITLILDDLHFLNSPDIRDALILLVDRMPATLRLVLAGRSEPVLPLARWRAAGLVSELRPHDLRFDLADSHALLNQTTSTPLAPADLQRLLDSTEGWAVGLHLTSLALRSAGQITPTLITQLSHGHGYIRDYLVDEIVRREPPAIQTFLLHTAVIERMSAELCDVLMQQLEPAQRPQLPSQAMLEQLERRGLFVSALDHERRWFRYHGLFAEALRAMLVRSHPDAIQRLHRAAADWFIQHGGIDELAAALHHLLVIEESEAAAILLEQHSLELIWARGEIQTLLRLVSQLPRSVVLARPRLALDVTWALLASVRLDQVEGNIAEIATLHGDAVAGEIAAIGSFIARLTGDLAASIELGDQALRLLGNEFHLIRYLVGMNQHNAYMMAGDLHAASQLASELSQTTRQALKDDRMPPFLTAAGVQICDAWVLINQARPHAAEILIRAGLVELERHQHPTTPTGMLLASLAEARYEQGDIADAERLARIALSQGERWWNPDLSIVAHDQLGRALRAQGDHVAAREHFQAVHELVRSYNIPYISARVGVGITWQTLLEGDPAPSERALAAAGVSADDQLDPALFDDYQLLARVDLARNRIGSAVMLATRLRAMAERGGFVMRIIQIDLLRARIAAAAGKRAEALECLEQALALAEPGGVIQVFRDEGDPIPELLQQIARSISHPLASAARRRLKLDTPMQPGHAAPLAEPLTAREQTILQLIDAGLSNQAIADQLVVSIHTVKKHITNLLAKLNAENRTTALARARQLGLLGR